MPCTHQFLDQVACPNNQNESRSNDRIFFPSQESYEYLSTIDLKFYPQLSNNQQIIHMEHAHSAHRMLINPLSFKIADRSSLSSSNQLYIYDSNF